MGKRFKRYLPFVTLFVFGGLFFLMRDTFFFHDEWTFLYKIVTTPYRFIFEPLNGHLMPIFNLIYLLEYRVFGLNYLPYQFVLLIFHFANGYFLYLIIKQLTKNQQLAILGFFLFILSSAYWEAIFSSSGLPYILYLDFISASILFFLKYRDTKKPPYLFLSAALSLLSAYTLGAGVFFSLLFLVAIIIEGIIAKKARLVEIIAFGVASIIPIFIYLKFVGLPIREGLDINKVIIFTATAIRWNIVGFYTSSPGFMKLFLLLVVIFGLILFPVLRREKTRKLFLAAVKKNIFWLFFSVLNLVYIFILTAISRYRIDMALAKSSRYTYSPLFFLIIINMIVLSGLLPLLNKKLKFVFLAYFVLLTLGHFYFFHLYYRNWVETISGPNRKLFERITHVSSAEELDKIELPSTFHPLYSANEIYLIYEKSVKR